MRKVRLREIRGHAVGGWVDLGPEAGPLPPPRQYPRQRDSVSLGAPVLRSPLMSWMSTMKGSFPEGP